MRVSYVWTFTRIVYIRLFRALYAVPAWYAIRYFVDLGVTI